MDVAGMPSPAAGVTSGPGSVATRDAEPLEQFSDDEGAWMTTRPSVADPLEFTVKALS